MITLIVLMVPTLIILNWLENSRSRKKVSVDGFKMINGHIVPASITRATLERNISA